jgi:hypothetical protein
MRVPQKTSTRYDLLDSLQDGQVWTVGDLVDDTGRAPLSVACVLARLHRDELVVWTHARGDRLGSTVRITDLGLRWLWAVNLDLPGQAVDLMLMILRTVEDGPMLTLQLIGHRSSRVHKAVLVLRREGYLHVQHRRTRAGADAPSRVSITSEGRRLLQSIRGIPCFETSTRTCYRAGSTP